MMMEGEKLPHFHEPSEFLSPQITDLLSDTAFIENGIAYKGME